MRGIAGFVGRAQIDPDRIETQAAAGEHYERWKSFGKIRREHFASAKRAGLRSRTAAT